jgi:hypothetical protein
VSVDGVSLGEEGEPVWLLDEMLATQGEHVLLVERDGREVRQVIRIGKP